MPDNMNPYMDSGMSPNGYMSPYGQPGYPDPMDPYAQQVWDQGQFGMPQPGYPGVPQPGMMDDFMNPGAMASPQDIYASQAMQVGAPGYGAPYDPAMGGMGAQPYMDPYGQQTMPMAQPGQQPMPMGQPGQSPYDPMQQIPSAGQTGQQAPLAPSQTGGFDPIQAAQAEQAAVQAQQAVAQQQAAQQQAAQQAAQQQQQAQQQAAQQAAQQQQQAAQQQPAKTQKRPPSQVQPMPVVGTPVVNPAKATSGRAKLALILSILSIILAVLPPIGLILAIVARMIAKSYKKNGGRAGAGDAAAVFSLVGLAFSIFMCAVVVWFIGYVNGAIIGSKAYMNPISFFNNSPLGNIFKIPTS